MDWKAQNFVKCHLSPKFINEFKRIPFKIPTIYLKGHREANSKIHMDIRRI